MTKLTQLFLDATFKLFYFTFTTCHCYKICSKEIQMKNYVSMKPWVH